MLTSRTCAAIRRTPVRSQDRRHSFLSRCLVLFQAIAEFPQLLCQGLGRAARVAFLLLPPAAADSSAAAVAAPSTIAPSASANDDGDVVGAAAAAAAVTIAAGTRTLSASTACREVCRRVADFESDHPAYPAFLDSLLLSARRGPAGGARVTGVARGDRAVREQEERSPNSSAPPLAMERGVMLDGAAPNHADVGMLAEYQRPQQPNQQHAAPRAGTAAATAPGTEIAGGVPSRRSRTEEPIPPLANDGQQQQQQQPLHGAPSASPVPLSPPVEGVRIAVTSEKALGAAMTAAAKGLGGGREAAAMLVLEGVEVPRNAGVR